MRRPASASTTSPLDRRGFIALHGIPWGGEDLLAAKGYRTTWGAKPYEDQVIDEDAGQPG